MPDRTERASAGKTTPAANRVGPSQADPGSQPEHLIGSPAHLHAAYVRAAAASARTDHLALRRFSSVPGPADLPSSMAHAAGELAALRALVRASATAYARQLRESQVPPEQMLVLVKQASAPLPTAGLAGQDLTADVVRWSIEAYFGD